MTVQVGTLDILTERAHFEPEVARAIGDAIAMQIYHSKDDLLTKIEFDAFRKGEFGAFRKEFDGFRTGEFGALRREFDAFRTGEFDTLSKEFDSFRKEFDTLRKEFDAFRVEVREEFAAVRAEFRQEFVIVRAEIRVAIADAKTDMIRWMFTAMAAQTALLVGIMYFMLQHVR